MDYHPLVKMVIFSHSLSPFVMQICVHVDVLMIQEVLCLGNLHKYSHVWHVFINTLCLIFIPHPQMLG